MRNQALGTAVALFLCLGLALWLWFTRGDRLSAAVRYRVEPGSIDCGRVENRANNAAVVDCVAKNLKDHRPFVAISTMRGIDEMVSWGLIGNSEGEVIEIGYATGMVAERNTLLLRHCPKPVRLANSESGTLKCAPAAISASQFARILW